MSAMNPKDAFKSRNLSNLRLSSTASDFDCDIGTSLETQCPSVDISSVIETSMAREQFRDLLMQESPENKINF